MAKPANEHFRLQLSINSDDNKKMVQREISERGNFSFFTEDNSYTSYTICFQLTPPTKLRVRGNDLRVHFRIKSNSMKTARGQIKPDFDPHEGDDQKTMELRPKLGLSCELLKILSSLF